MPSRVFTFGHHLPERLRFVLRNCIHHATSSCLNMGLLFVVDFIFVPIIVAVQSFTEIRILRLIDQTFDSDRSLLSITPVVVHGWTNRWFFIEKHIFYGIVRWCVSLLTMNSVRSFDNWNTVNRSKRSCWSTMNAN